jgi:hypothetical protein
MVAFGLGASEPVSVKQYASFMEAVRIHRPEAKRPDLTAAREEFQEWVLESGLKTCVEAAHGFLESARDACTILAYGVGATASPSEWDKRRVAGSSAYHKKGLRQKIRRLEREYGADLGCQLAGCVLSVNQARNCFVHRQGIVGTEEATTSDVLRVEWDALEVWTRGPQAARVDRLVGKVGDKVDIEAKTVRRVKEVKIGDRLRFTPEEFAQITGTIVLFGNELVRGLRAYAASRGFAV